MNTTKKNRMSRRTIHMIVLALFVAVTGTVVLSSAVLAGSGGIDKIREGVNSVANPTGLDLGGSNTNTDSLIAMTGKIVRALLGLLGAAFLILVLYAGVIWMFAMGDTGKVKKAIGIIRTASIGIAVVLLSFLIVNLVLNILEQTSDGGTTTQHPTNI